jgi:hypothetical protein
VELLIELESPLDPEIHGVMGVDGGMARGG